AIDALERLTALDPADGAAPHNLGALCLREGKTQDAIDSTQESLRRRPKSAITLLQLGNALRDANRFEEAEVAWSRALELDPTNVVAQSAIQDVLTDAL